MMKNLIRRATRLEPRIRDSKAALLRTSGLRTRLSVRAVSAESPSSWWRFRYWSSRLWSAFVLDYGMLWLGRRQAQNAADAGALSGSIALAKDDRTWAPLGTNALVTSSAKNTAETNRVLGVTPVALPSLQCPPWMTAPNNVNCIRVDVYRDGTNGSSALPVFSDGFSAPRRWASKPQLRRK